jgi:O-antigen/teichoic acid export membrane protein
VAWLLAAQLLSWGLRLVEAAIVPRILGDTGVGQVGYAGTVLALVALAVMFGGPEHVIRSLVANREEGERIATAMLVARAVLLLPLCLLVYLVFRFAFHTAPVLLALLLISMVNCCLSQILDVLTAWRQAFNQFAVISRTQMLQQSVGLPSTIGLVMLTRSPLGAAWGWAAGTLTSVIAIVSQRGSPIRLVRVRWADFVHMAREGLHYTRYGIFLWLYGDATSILYVTWIAGFADTGWFMVSQKLVGVLFYVPMTLLTAMRQSLIDAYERAREEYEALASRYISITIVMAIPFSLLLILRSHRLLEVLHYKPSFYHAAIVMQLIGVELWVRWASVGFGALLVVTDRAKVRANVVTIAAPYNLISTPLLVYAFHRWMQNGALGAIVAAESTEIMIVAMYMSHFRGTGLVRTTFRVLFRGLLAGVVPLAVLQLPMRNLPLFLLVAGASVVLFVPAAVLTGALPAGDAKLLLSAIRSRTRR